MQQQPQSVVTMTTQQPSVIPSSKTPESTQHALKVIRGLAISEVVLGSLCFIIDIVVLILLETFYYDPVFVLPYRNRFSFGEGMWCGVWIIVAGAIGISMAKQNSKRSLINCHLGFSIVGAIFSAILFSISVVLIIDQELVFEFTGFYFGYGFKIAQSILSFSSMVLLIVSAAYCCYLLPGCCQTGEPTQPQVVYAKATP